MVLFKLMHILPRDSFFGYLVTLFILLLILFGLEWGAVVGSCDTVVKLLVP